MAHDPALRFARYGSACLVAPWTPKTGRQKVGVLVAQTGRKPERLDFFFPWPAGGDHSALLQAAIVKMGKLSSVKQAESVSSGFGGKQALSRIAYRGNTESHLTTDSGFEQITIGTRTWQRSSSQEGWARRNGRTRLGPVDNFAQQGGANVRLIAQTRLDGRRVEELAYWLPGQQYWYQVWIDPQRLLILKDEIVTPGHFLSDRFYDFNKPVAIRPPAGGG